MYGKKLMRKVGSLVIIAAIVASAFAIMPKEERANASVLIAPPPNVTITEIMYKPSPAFNEWVELYNPTDTAINLSGWYIKDEANNTFGDIGNLILQPYSYAVIQDAGVLNNDGDTVYLYNAQDELVGSVTFGDIAAENYSIELNETGGWEQSQIEGGTPGMPNSVMNAPVTTYDLQGDLTAWGWYVSNVTVTFNATDETGVKETKYKIDDGEWQTYTEPFVISEPGIHTVYYYSVDIWGVEETEKNFEVKIANLSSALQVTPTEANWNETATIEVNNAEGNVALYAPGESTPRRGPQAGPYVRWSGVLFDKSGKWWVVDSVDSEVNAVPIDVKPIALDVNATPDEVDYVKSGIPGCYINIEGTVMMNGQPATAATVKLIFPDGSYETKNVGSDGSFVFNDINIGNKGAGKYNVTAFIGDESAPNAFGYDIVTVNTVDANITLVENTAVGGFDIGIITFQITYPEDGTALLPGNNFNISIYKGDELFAWYNSTTGMYGNITFDVAGKLLNLSAAPMWEEGDYKIDVKVDVTGDGNWEYVGEESFTIQPAPPVNIKILKPADKILNVLDPANNSQIIQVQIFGENMNTYGTPEALGIGANNENVTDRISIEGDILYTPPRDAYEYIGNGTWNITVFPTIGNGKIYVNVTWPDKGTANETIEVVDGGYVSAQPTAVIVDTPTTIEVEVKDKTKTAPIYNANVTLVYESGLYGVGDKIASLSQANAEGKYIFNITSTKAATNIIVIAKFEYGGTQYAYACIVSNPAHDLNVALSPANVLAGRMTEFTVNITRGNASYADEFEYYILNESQLADLHDGKLDLDLIGTVYEGNKANDTFSTVITQTGTYYLYVRTKDKKHDNLNNEPSFEVSKASVSVTPTLLVKNVDKNVTLVFNVEWNGEPLNGTLKIHGLQEIESFEGYVEGAVYELEIVNGEGNLTNVTAIAVGNVTFEFRAAEEGSVYVEADGTLPITTPSIEITEPAEKIAFLGEENLITIAVKHPLTGEGCAGLKVEIETPASNGRIDVGETDENGKLTFGIIPLQTGKIKIYVEGDEAGSIDIWIGLRIHVEPQIEAGKETIITVTTRGGKPIEGATVKVNGATIGTTNANGEIKYKPEKDLGGKTITITAEKTGYYSAERTVEVKKAPEGPGFELIGLVIGAILALVLVRRRRK